MNENKDLKKLLLFQTIVKIFVFIRQEDNLQTLNALIRYVQLFCRAAITASFIFSLACVSNIPS